MKIVFNTLVFLVFFTSIIGCKKDKDSAPPSIFISAPAENKIYKVFDTIQIIAEVSDEAKLVNISVKLLNASLSPIEDEIIIKPISKSYSVNKFMLLYDIHLASGTYFIAVEAGDGNNIATAYRKIYINEEPLKRTGFILFGKSFGNTLNISKIDSSYNTMPVMSNTVSDYSGSAVSSYYQDVFVAGKYSGSYRAIDLENNTQKWSIPAIVGSSPYFNGVSTNGISNFISYYGSKVKALDQNGQFKFQATVGVSGYYPELVFDSGEYLLMEQIDAASSDKKIVVYNRTTGAGVQEFMANLDVVAFCKKNANEIFVFGNDNSGQGYIKIYDIPGNSIWSPHVLPSGKVLSASQMDADNYLIGHADGNVYLYTYNTSNFISILNGVTPNKIQYDVVKKQLIVTGSYDVKIYDYSTSIGAPVKTIASVDSIYNVEVLYNK